MRIMWVGLMTVALTAPALRADDKAEAAKAASKTPAEQLTAITEQFDKDFQEVVKEFREAKDDKSRSEARDKAFKLPETYGQKMLAFAEKHPNDQAGTDALMWICSVPSERGLPIKPALLQSVRAKAKNDGVKLRASASLANMILEAEAPSPAQKKEAEALLAEIVAKGKTVKDLPGEIVEEAEGNLWELRNLVIDQAAPVAESTDLDGKAVNLSDHKGKVVVLDFWATWCGPCVAAIPHVRDLVKKHDGKPFVFISVSADQKKEALKDFLDKEKMPWTHWWNGTEGGVVRKWNIKAFPTLFVIDAKGNLRGKIIGGGKENQQKLDELVEKLIKEAGGKSE